MAQQGQKPVAPSYQPPSRNTTLIQSLREQPSFLMQQYNQKLKAQNQSKGIRRAGGVYIPPHKLRQLQKQMLETDPSSEAHQKMMWELLRKSINGIVNKVNIANIQNIVVELFNQNIYRGRGLLARAIIKAQMASPNFTHVYSALVAVINTKVPEIGLLVAKRVLIQFKRSYERNNKIVCVATTKMIAHLINQRVIGYYIALQILLIMLSTPSQDSVQIACDFMIEVGQVLSEITPAGATAIFQRFKGLLHEAQIEQKAQYSIQNLFAVRKTNFKQHPGVIPDLDLVQPQDQITHQLDVQEDIKGDQQLNLFKKDPKFIETQEEWQKIKLQILGQQNIARLKQPDQYQQQWDQQPPEEGIQDLTEQDLINLRKTIYLAIQSTVNFQQCAHKILKMNIAKGYEHELVDMILQCCMMERIYQSFFGFLAERFCLVDDKFKQLFIQAFLNHYNNIFKQEANKIRNLAHIFSHLFYKKALDWRVFQTIRLSPDTTTAAARMFLKIFLKDIAENMGINNLALEFKKQDMRQYYEGLFPMDNANDLRFAINYYTAIGLGKLTQQMRQVLALQEEVINERKRIQQQAMAKLLEQQEEEMMRMAIQEQRLKQQAKKSKEEQERNQRQRERQNEKQKQKQRQKQKNKIKDKDRERRKSRDRYDQRRYNSSDEEKDRDRRRERSRSRDRRNKQDDRYRKQERIKKGEKQQEKYKEKQREREKDKDKQRQRQRQRERERQRSRSREKQKQLIRERQKQRQILRQQEEKRKKLQRQRQQQRQREQRLIQKQLERKKLEQEEKRLKDQQQRQRKILAQKRALQKQRKQRVEEKKNDRSRKRRQRSPSQQKRKNKNIRKRKDDETPRRKKRSRSSSSSSSSETPVKKPTKVDQSKKKRPQSEDEQSSSGLQSSSSDSSSQSSSEKVVAKKKANQSDDSVQSSSSESESKNVKVDAKKRKRIHSQSS